MSPSFETSSGKYSLCFSCFFGVVVGFSLLTWRSAMSSIIFGPFSLLGNAHLFNWLLWWPVGIDTWCRSCIPEVRIRQRVGLREKIRRISNLLKTFEVRTLSNSNANFVTSLVKMLAKYCCQLLQDENYVHNATWKNENLNIIISIIQARLTQVNITNSPGNGMSKNSNAWLWWRDRRVTCGYRNTHFHSHVALLRHAYSVMKTKPETVGKWMHICMTDSKTWYFRNSAQYQLKWHMIRHSAGCS